MATLTPSTLQLTKSNPIFSQSPLKLHAPSYFSFTTRATTDESSPSDTEEETVTETASDPDSFESKLSQVRLRYRSGTGKKAELRKTRKGKTATAGSGSGSGSGANMFLPPIPLKEPVSDGLNVGFGFSPYSERVNGRIAGLGLTALLLVELATGKSVINYHTPSIVFIQIYFVAALAAVYLKFEKEKVSVWPK